MSKKVIVKALSPFGIKGRIFNRNAKIGPIDLSTGNILLCLSKGAEVFEVLSDKSLVKLNRDNFDKDNSVKAKTSPTFVAANSSNPVIKPNNKKDDIEVKTDNKVVNEKKDDTKIKQKDVEVKTDNKVVDEKKDDTKVEQKDAEVKTDAKATDNKKQNK